MIGLYELEPGDANVDRRLADTSLIDHWRIATNAERTADEHALCCRSSSASTASTWEDNDIDGIAMCSSVPRVTGALRRMSERYFGFPAAGGRAGRAAPGMPILYDNPKEVGADRIANAVGRLRPLRRPDDRRRLRHRHHLRRHLRPRASTSAARSSRASRSASTRSSAGPPRCAGSSWSSPAT